MVRKGDKPWNKGLTKLTDYRVKKSAEKISEKLTGRPVSIETREKIRQTQIGKKMSEESKQKMSDNHNHNYEVYKNPIRNEKIRQANLGRKYSEETKMKMRISAFKTCGVIYPKIGHNEKNILDKLEIELGCRIIRQFEVEGYFIDGYIPEISLAIEIDERPKNKERDIERQKIIENKLNCKFMRINDFD
jgi:hypothetical protein